MIETNRPHARALAVTEILNRHFPSIQDSGLITVETIDGAGARLHMQSDPSHIRPGGTVSGPTLFKLADLAVWVLILDARGEAGVQAVTSNLSINFLRRPPAGDLVAQARLLKLGRRLAFAEVTLMSLDDPRTVAHATATYALP